MLAAPAILSRAAEAAEFEYKLSNNVSVDHPFNLRAGEAVARIKKETGGRLDIQIFPSNQLGSDVDVLSQTRAGAVEFQALSAVTLSVLVPVASITGVGFAFKSYDEVWAATDGRLGAFVRAQIASRGLRAFDRIWDIGFRQITNNVKPISSPADLRGLKIRVPPGALWTSLFQSFGASPTTVSFAELYSALQTRIADGEENPLSIISTAKLYEVQKYATLTSHMWDGLWLLANGDAWRRLPEDIRKIVAQAFDEAALLERDDLARQGTSLQTELAAKGLTFNAVEQVSFRDVLRSSGFYPKWSEAFSDEAWSLLEQYSGPLG
jgi:tripartite ATP-independent transporter DctP family solute receptor